MITLEDFLQMAMDTTYKINIYDTSINEQIITQKDIDEIYDYFWSQENYDIFLENVESWDINEKKELTINI